MTPRVERVEHVEPDSASPWTVQLPVIRPGSPDFVALTQMSRGVT